MLFTLEDQPDVITALGKSLDQLERGLRSHLSVEDGLVLRSSNGRGDSWKAKKTTYKCNALPLRSKKRASSKRVGVRAEMLRKAVKLPEKTETEENEKPGSVLTEIVIDDVEDDAKCFQARTVSSLKHFQYTFFL